MSETTETKTAVYDYEEVAKHNTHDDLWVILNGKVYDITQYIDEHPGGEEVILDLAGQDCTEAFDDIGHSDEATEILKKLYLGDVKGAVVKDVKQTSRSAGVDKQDGTINFPLLALVILLLAVGFYYFNQ